MSGKGEVEGVNDCGFRKDSGVVVIGGSVNLMTAREGINGGKFSTGEDLPNNIKVL